MTVVIEDTAITRHHTNHRRSSIVVHGNTVYLSGQVARPGGTVAEQTREILGNIDRLLAEVGSDKSRLLRCEIWLNDIRDFDAMNAVYDAWLPAGQAPARACAESRLAHPGLLVEIIVTAAC